MWLSCEHYGLEDNTTGQTGYHCYYRPLCGDQYRGNETVTDQMRADIGEHYEQVRATKAAEDAAVSDQASPMDRDICSDCGTVCYGDCRG